MTEFRKASIEKKEKIGIKIREKEKQVKGKEDNKTESFITLLSLWSFQVSETLIFLSFWSIM